MRAAVTLMLALACAGCAGWQSALDPHGLPGFTLYRLMLGIMLTCTVVWIVVVAVLVVALKRTKREPVAAPQTERRMTIAIWAALAATIVIVSAFTAASFIATPWTSADRDALTIRVRGFQWWWEVNYFDPKTGETFASANEIVVPVGRSVRLMLVGADVIHSFWVPSLAGKQDLVPGRDNDLTFVAQRPGVYRGQCAEFCGLQHARMAFMVIALPQTEFERWWSMERSDAIAPVDEEHRKGQEVFGKSCAACHTVRGTAATGITGPDLTHVGSRRTIAAGVLETTRGSLAAWIADPQTIKPGSNMPMMPLGADELRAVSAYMAGLK